MPIWSKKPNTSDSEEFDYQEAFDEEMGEYGDDYDEDVSNLGQPFKGEDTLSKGDNQGVPPEDLLTAKKVSKVLFLKKRQGYDYRNVETFVEQTHDTLKFLEFSQAKKDETIQKLETQVNQLLQEKINLQATMEMFREQGDVAVLQTNTGVPNVESRNDELVEELARIKGELSKSVEENATLNEELSVVNSELEELREWADTNYETITQLQTKFLNENGGNLNTSALTEEVTVLRARIVELENELTNVQGEKVEPGNVKEQSLLEQENLGLKEKVVALEEELITVREQLLKVDTENGASLRTPAGLPSPPIFFTESEKNSEKVDTGVLENKIFELKKTVTLREEELEAVRSDNATKNDELNSLRSKVVSLESNIADLREQQNEKVHTEQFGVTDLDEALAVVEREKVRADEAETKNRELLAKLTKISRETSQWEDEKNTYTQKLSNATVENETLLNEKLELQQRYEEQLAVALRDKKEVTERFEELNNSVALLEKEISEKNAELATYSNTSEELNALKHSLEDAVELNRDLETEKEMLTKQVEVLNNKITTLTTLVAKNEQSEQLLAEKENEIKEIKLRSGSLNDELDASLNQLVELRRVVQAKDQQIQTLTSDYEKVERDYEEKINGLREHVVELTDKVQILQQQVEEEEEQKGLIQQQVDMVNSELLTAKSENLYAVERMKELEKEINDIKEDLVRAEKVVVRKEEIIKSMRVLIADIKSDTPAMTDSASHLPHLSEDDNSDGGSDTEREVTTESSQNPVRGSETLKAAVPSEGVDTSGDEKVVTVAKVSTQPSTSGTKTSQIKVRKITPVKDAIVSDEPKVSEIDKGEEESLSNVLPSIVVGSEGDNSAEENYSNEIWEEVEVSGPELVMDDEDFSEEVSNDFVEKNEFFNEDTTAGGSVRQQGNSLNQPLGDEFVVDEVLDEKDTLETNPVGKVGKTKSEKRKKTHTAAEEESTSSNLIGTEVTSDEENLKEDFADEAGERKLEEEEEVAETGEDKTEGAGEIVEDDEIPAHLLNAPELLGITNYLEEDI